MSPLDFNSGLPTDDPVVDTLVVVITDDDTAALMSLPEPTPVPDN